VTPALTDATLTRVFIAAVFAAADVLFTPTTAAPAPTYETAKAGAWLSGLPAGARTCPKPSQDHLSQATAESGEAWAQPLSAPRDRRLATDLRCPRP